MRPALAADRAMSVISHMTVHPLMSFTLSELSKSLDVSPASMSSILLALSEWGYVIRDRRHRTYSLGPAVVAAGHAASARHPVVEGARPELRRLAELGTECVGSSAVGDDILILAIEGEPTSNSRESWIGQRIPLLPPFGQIFLAWASDNEKDRWLGRAGADAANRYGGELKAALESVRRRGVAIGLMNDPVEAVVDLISAATQKGVSESLIHGELARLIPQQMDDYVLRDIDPSANYDVANLASPVFGAEGEVVFSMTLTGLPKISGAELIRFSRQMLDSSRTITRKIGGRWPAIEGPELLVDPHAADSTTVLL